jgi:hypothetical protein
MLLGVAAVGLVVTLWLQRMREKSPQARRWLTTAAMFTVTTLSFRDWRGWGHENMLGRVLSIVIPILFVFEATRALRQKSTVAPTI